MNYGDYPDGKGDQINQESHRVKKLPLRAQRDEGCDWWLVQFTLLIELPAYNNT